jgi:hypothetical protein
MLKRFRVAGLCLVAVFAMSAVAASAASATSTNNPQWDICHNVGAGNGHFTDSKCETAGTGEWEAKILGNAELEEVTAKAKGNQKLSVPGAKVTIVCKSYSLKAGAVIVGSAAPAAGTDEETIEYKECEVEGSPKCEINKVKGGKATITTEPLKSWLGFKTKEAAEKEESNTLTYFAPQTPPKFVAFELKKETGGSCPFGSEGISEVEGQVAVENIEGSVHAVKHTLKAPATAIKAYWVNEGGKTVEKKVTELKLKGIIKFAATYEGESEVELVSKSNWWIFN